MVIFRQKMEKQRLELCNFYLSYFQQFSDNLFCPTEANGCLRDLSTYYRLFVDSENKASAEIVNLKKGLFTQRNSAQRQTPVSKLTTTHKGY